MSSVCVNDSLWGYLFTRADRFLKRDGDPSPFRRRDFRGGAVITVNGENRQLNAATVSGLVEEMKLPAPLLLIEHNGTALRKADWEGTPLCDGDRIEILRISAGG